MLPHPQSLVTYPVVVPIETNRGRGETRSIGPSWVTFATSVPFETGEAVRFAMKLPGHGPEVLDVFCAGAVCAVSFDGELFVVEASIEESQISINRKEENR